MTTFLTETCPIHVLCSISCDYLMFGISAMSSTVLQGPLSGRPFGGLASLIYSKYEKYIVNHKCSERFNILLLGILLLWSTCISLVLLTLIPAICLMLF